MTDFLLNQWSSRINANAKTDSSVSRNRSPTCTTSSKGKMSHQKIIAWISIGSTYTYLTAMRLKSMTQEYNFQLKFVPISIRKIMKEMDNIPFPPSKEPKVRHMWRDIERRAKYYGIPIPKVPAPYPLKNFDLANQVGVVANTESWFLDYLETTYSLWFLEGLEAGSDENLSRVFSLLNKDASDVISRATKASTIQIYEHNTELAKSHGVFGVPTFSIGKEIFWGDDRFEDAIRFLAQSDV